MKHLIALTVLGVAALWPTTAQAHTYDRDDSEHPLRYMAYVVYPFGIAAEYLVLRPIHWVVSQPHLDVLFGHEVQPREDSKEYMDWE